MATQFERRVEDSDLGYRKSISKDLMWFDAVVDDAGGGESFVFLWKSRLPSSTRTRAGTCRIFARVVAVYLSPPPHYILYTAARKPLWCPKAC
jgi:hypothetical protein